MKFYKRIRSFLILILVTAVLLLLFRTVFMLGYVPTGSMEPTLKAGSMILGLRCFDEPQKGDIVVFRHEDSYLVKRVAAVEGDSIEYQGEVVTVPKECYYMLGDNEGESYDSRYWDEPFIRRDSVVAVVLFH